MEVYSDFKVQFFQESSEIEYESATSRWNLQNVHKVLNGEGVVIAIVDTGIDIDHEAFRDKREQIKGLNFVADDKDAFSKPEPHGNMAAFVAAGKGFTAKHNQKGEEIKPDPIDIASGVAPNAKLIVCRVGNPYKVECVIEALKELIKLKKEEQNKLMPKGEREWGVDVVSMSIGFPHLNGTLKSTTATERRKEIRELIEELSHLKVIVVVAAGNYGDNKPTIFPANHQDVFSVGALSKYNKPAAMNPSHDIDVYAPGVSIAAPHIHKRIHDGVETTLAGTSCAAPAIAGLVALKIQFEKNKHELFKDVKKDSYVKEILIGENIHFQDMEKMFKDMRTDANIPYVLNPYDYFRIKCRLDIE